MKASAVSKVSTIALDNIVGDIHLLLDSCVQSLKESLGTVLQRRGIEFDSELAAIFQNPSLVQPFKDLHSSYLRKKYYTEEMGLLVSHYFVIKLFNFFVPLPPPKSPPCTYMFARTFLC